MNGTVQLERILLQIQILTQGGSLTIQSFYMTLFLKLKGKNRMSYESNPNEDNDKIVNHYKWYSVLVLEGELSWMLQRFRCFSAGLRVLQKPVNHSFIQIWCVGAEIQTCRIVVFHYRNLKINDRTTVVLEKQLFLPSNLGRVTRSFKIVIKKSIKH